MAISIMQGGISWHHYLLHQEGMEAEAMSKIHEVMTATEAAEKWGIAKVTVRQACSGYAKAAPRFTTNAVKPLALAMGI